MGIHKEPFLIKILVYRFTYGTAISVADHATPLNITKNDSFSDKVNL